MKYSIRGNLKTADGTDVVNLINSYDLWRLVTGQNVDNSGANQFTFEAWVNVISDKDKLFSALKPFVNSDTGNINWHECTHDEPAPKPCVIMESYSR